MTGPYISPFKRRVDDSAKMDVGLAKSYGKDNPLDLLGQVALNRNAISSQRKSNDLESGIAQHLIDVARQRKNRTNDQQDYPHSE